MSKVFTILTAALLAGPMMAQETMAQEASVPTTEPTEPVLEEAEMAEMAEDVAPEPALLLFEASEVTLEEFLWLSRPIVVFADTPADPRFREQMELLLERQDELIARDVVVITDTDPAARSDIRLKLRPRGFQMTLIGKDGGVKLRKPFAWDVREISRTIDKMPLRLEEIRRGG